MTSWLFSGVRIDSFFPNLGLFVLRAFAGVSLAVAHGFQKLPPSAGFVEGVAALGFPVPGLFAWMTTATELLGGLALAAGFLTRPAALLIAINMGVAGFLRHAPDAYSAKELALLFFAIAFMFLCVGGGRFSVDRMLRRG